MKKKCLLLSTGDTFGAYEYIYRMAKAMLIDYEVTLVVKDKRKVDRWIFRIDVLPPKRFFFKRALNFSKKRFGVKNEIFESNLSYVFSPYNDELIQHVKADTIIKSIPFVPDIIISGMTDGFLNTSTLLDLHTRTGAKIFQVMIDMSLLTGGCHVVWDCEGFKNNCNNCPAISNKKFINYAGNNLALKKRNIQQGDFKLLVIPGWTLHQATLSAIYENRVKVHSCSIIDTNIFTNANRNIAKQVFGITHGQKVIFAGSSNQKAEVKGRKYFVDALSSMGNEMEENLRKKVVILMIGFHNEEDELTRSIQFQKIFIDFITDYRLLSLAYQASDVFVCPSLEEGGPMMVAESLACGTPVVGFETGSLFDNSLIENGVHGYRIKMKDTNELAIALKKIILLSDTDFYKMSQNARNQAVQYSSEKAFLRSFNDI